MDPAVLHTTDFSHISNTLDTSVLHLAGYLVLAHVTCPLLTQVWRRDCSCFSGLECRVFSEWRVWRVFSWILVSLTQLDSGSYVLTQRWILLFCTINMSSTRLAFSTSATHHGVGAVKPLRCLSRYCSGLSRKHGRVHRLRRRRKVVGLSLWHVLCREGWQTGGWFMYVVCCIAALAWLWMNSKGGSKQEGCRIPGGFRESVIFEIKLSLKLVYCVTRE